MQHNVRLVDKGKFGAVNVVDTSELESFDMQKLEAIVVHSS